MTLTAFFSSLTSAREKRRAQVAATFEQLAMQVANDVALDPEQVDEQLDRLGKSAADLNDAANLILERRQCAAQVARSATLKAEHDALYREIESAEAAHREAVRLAGEKHTARITELRQRLAAVDAERDRAQTARNKLITSCPDYARLSELYSEHGSAVIELQRLRPQLSQVELLLKQPATATCGNLTFHTPQVDDSARQNAELQASRIRGEIAQHEATRDLVAAEIARLEAKALQS